MGSSTHKKWCHKTLTTCTIKGYHVLIILTLSLFTAFWIFQPSASNLTELLTTNERYKAKLNESKQALDTSIQQQSNLQYKEKALESSLDEKTKELNNLHSNNIKLKTHIKQLTRVKQQLQNQSDIQKDIIKQLQHTAQQKQNKSQIKISTTKTEYKSWYIKNYNQWIQGIGTDIMFNNESNSNCLFSSDSFMFHKPPLINQDTLYEGATYCEKYRFSHIFDRVITIHCEYLQRQEPEKAGIKYYESDSIFNGRAPKSNDPRWVILSFENGKKNHFTIDLKDTTQSTWIYCNNAYDFHVSLVPLRKSNEKIYSDKRGKINDNFGVKIPPNVVLFIMSAASRNNFMTAAVNSMHYLHSLQQNNNGKNPSDVLQFFRFSTVGSGTKNNLNALIAGKCSYCDLIDDNKCEGLASYYDRLGYYVWGLNEYKYNNKLQNDGLCDFVLGDNVTPRGCKFGHHIQVETGTEFVKQAIHIQRKYDQGVPHLMIINVQSNRVANGGMMYNLDRFIRNMFEMVRKENTVINIISDHGPIIVDEDLYSELEYKNPVNIMLVPKWLRNYTNLHNLQLNQQRFVQHYDMHLFYKELLWKLYKKNELKSFSKANKKRDRAYQNMIFENLPKINEVPLSKSIMDEIIDIDRDCQGIADGFCLCNNMQLKEINDELITNNINYIQIIVKYINKLTGNGEWDCHQLDIKEFTIRAYIENKEKTLLKIAISKVINDAIIEDKLWKDKRLLSFYATFSRENDNLEYKLENVMRIDDMRYEKCLTIDYDKQQFSKVMNDFDFGSDKLLKPMFINKEIAVTMVKAYVNSHGVNKIDLKLCNCKEINLNDITVIKSLASRKNEDKITMQLRKKSQERVVYKGNQDKNVSVIEEKVDTIYGNNNQNNDGINGRNRRGKGKRKRVNKNVEDENDAAENDTEENISKKSVSGGNNIRLNKSEENENDNNKNETESDGNNENDKDINLARKVSQEDKENNEKESDVKKEKNSEKNDRNRKNIYGKKNEENDSEENKKDENNNRSNEVRGNENEKRGSERHEVEGNDSEEDDIKRIKSKENEAKEKNSDAFELTDDMRKIKRGARKQKRLEKRNARNGKGLNVLDDLMEKVNDDKELNKDNKGLDDHEI